MESKPAHWIQRVAARAGWEGAQGLEVDARASAVDAWAAVTRACRVNDSELARQMAAYFRLQVADLDAAEPRALKVVPEAVAREYCVFPLRLDDRHLVVATGNPVDLGAEQVLGFTAGRTPLFEVAPPHAIQAAIDARYSPSRAVADLLFSLGADRDAGVRVVQDRQQAIDHGAVDEAPIVQLTSLILREAVEARASDVHIEPRPHGGVVRFRVDGVMRHHLQLPPAALPRVVSRIKVLSEMDIADHLRPQDGRMALQVDGRTYDLRVSTVPTREAEKAVIRILDPQGSQRLEDLSLPAEERDQLERLLLHRDGIVVVTGPTGSGKTTTLYAALRALATGEVNITTVEDPVEYELPGITQIPVNSARGVTFASALRAILRQDPDIVFVGEIRDGETAQIAVQASMTGHLVLATLHTNDAVGVIPRLLDLGLDRPSIASTLRGVLAQRLLRRVCPHCAQPVDGSPTPAETVQAQRYGVPPVVRAVGCAQCGGTGYRGRIPVVEALLVDGHLQELISRGESDATLQRAALAGGMRRMAEVALARARAGETTLEEVERVMGAVEERPAPAESAPPHALVVDDAPENRLLARVVLEQEGFQVTEAEDGLAALQQLESGEVFDLVVLDLDMPRLDGNAVLARVRRTPATAALPVIVLTGTIDPDAEVRLLEQGADDFIRKPMDPARFLARVKGVLRRAALQPAVA